MSPNMLGLHVRSYKNSVMEGKDSDSRWGCGTEQ